MKKSFIAILLIQMILLCGCNLKTPENTPSEEPTKATEETTDPKEAYLDIERREIAEYERLYFGFEDSENAFIISLPSEWKINKDSDGYLLTRGRTDIGRIYCGESRDADRWTLVTSQQSTVNGINKQRIVEMSESGDDLEFRHRIRFEYDDVESRVITLVCEYSELDDIAERTVALAARTEHIGNALNLNMLSKLADGNIIILGNSFIGSSKIGTTLKSMLSANSRALNVTAVSRGYAEVDTYIGDELLMSDIRAGVYNGVFICGFYANEEADHLAILKEACDISGTELVIFPAHNEFEDCIKIAQERCPELKTVDWKGEIDMLIESGIDQWDFCVNDTHKHSTPLAGYVGAQMIYRAIYGEIPTEPVNTQDLSWSTVKDILGDYTDTGRVPVDQEILYFD